MKPNFAAPPLSSTPPPHSLLVLISFNTITMPMFRISLKGGTCISSVTLLKLCWSTKIKKPAHVKAHISCCQCFACRISAVQLVEQGAWIYNTVNSVIAVLCTYLSSWNPGLVWWWWIHCPAPAASLAVCEDQPCTRCGLRMRGPALHLGRLQAASQPQHR